MSALEVTSLACLSPCPHQSSKPKRLNNIFSNAQTWRNIKNATFCSKKCGPLMCSLVDQSRVDEVSGFTKEENALIDALIGIQGRGVSASPQQLQLRRGVSSVLVAVYFIIRMEWKINVQEIESAVQVLEGIRGVPDPTSSSLIEGCWQLMFTTRPGTASPIQRTFVGVDLFRVFQEVYLRTDDPRVPYPVPFKLLGDEAKGWLDTTYLSQSGNIRISRGNKGTTFVLQKVTEARQNLLSTISSDSGVQEAINRFIASNRNAVQGQLELIEGEWKMIWSSQIVKPDGKLKFLVHSLFGLKFSINGTYVKSGDNIYDVKMDDGAFLAGPYGVPVEMESKFKIEVLYSDGKIRITRGYNKILFVHVRVDGASQI
ncbi:hypothetical protein Leryth_003884 [Lithospermum erythrorhizon]|nr:hypothetical protein Leryth_003884 [Lithospermum erythrorhizon]